MRLYSFKATKYVYELEIVSGLFNCTCAYEGIDK